MKTKQIKVLIVEQYHHLKVLENLYHLLKNKCSITFYLNKPSKKHNFYVLFPSAMQSQVIINRFHGTTFFVWLLFYGKKFEYINISTGPEGNHFSNIINILFFYICCTVYRDKIILTIKNIRPYLKSTPGIFSYLRSKSIKKLQRFTFETKTMRHLFSKNADLSSCFLGLSYDRYTDLLDLKSYEMLAPYSSDKIKIGLLGVINLKRRDYSQIINVLEQLSVEERSNLLFVTLGACYGGYHNEVVKSLSEYVKVDCQDGLLSAQEFDKRGLSCDLLISPLKKSLEYGKFKGSGSFGDAVYLRKRVILPFYVDEEKEFEEIAIYYRDSEDLLEIFKKIKESSKIIVNPMFYKKYTTENVFKNLIKDLKLC